jgi:hypothetical protein
MKKLVSMLVFSVLALNLVAQEFEVPNNYVLSSKEDYVKYEKSVLAGIDWLLRTPLNVQEGKRKEVNTFVMQWISGTPTFSIELKEEIVTFMKPNPDLLMVFLCGWTKYAVETKDYTNKVKGMQRGVEAVIEFYVKNKAYLQADSHVEQYMKLKDSGKLEEYISKHA